MLTKSSSSESSLLGDQKEDDSLSVVCHDVLISGSRWVSVSYDCDESEFFEFETSEN